MSTELVLREVVGDLAQRRVPWALVGGMAVGVQSEPRFTRDVDIAVAVDSDSSAVEIVRHLNASGWSTTSVLEEKTTGRIATVRFRRGRGQSAESVLDVLFCSSGIEAEIVRDAELIEVVAGLTAPVARIGHLLALKTLSVDVRRIQDRLDFANLYRNADRTEVIRAREALDLITARGFSRGKQLAAEFASLISATDAG